MGGLASHLFVKRKPPAKRVVPKRLLPLNKKTSNDIIQAGLANRKQEIKGGCQNEN